LSVEWKVAAKAMLKNRPHRLCFILAALAAATLPVQARSRDAVLSGAFGCAPIGNSLQWLDCYYGAAQPARAALGLKSALPAQLALAASPPHGVPQNLDVRDDVMAEASRCQDLVGERAWLDCYYAAAQSMRAALSLTPVAQAGIKSDLPALAPRRSARTYGVFAMASYKFNQAGLFTVTLANGQSWRQLAGDTDRAHWRLPAFAYNVAITHGFLGSYNLQLKGHAGLFKVAPVP
jgi:hypothetical protein